MSPPVTPKTPPSFIALPDAQARRWLDEILGQLSPVQRQILAAHLRNREDPIQIAARLGLPRDAVRASLAYALAQLRMALSDAPLEKSREDWLERCRDLLTSAPLRRVTPTVEIELPGMAAPHEPVAPSASVDAHANFLIVESRHTPATAPARTAATKPSPASTPAREFRLPSLPANTVPTPVSTPTPTRRAPTSSGLFAHLPALLALLVIVVTGLLAWSLWGPRHSTPVVNTEPLRVPALDEPAAPLTAPDFRLVLLRQQHEGLLEDLDFYVWLAEQDLAP